MFVNCDSQEEVDELWEKLLTGGKKGNYGWLIDKFGLSWQIIPSALIKMLNDLDPIKSKRVMTAMQKMDKIDINTLKQAYRRH